MDDCIDLYFLCRQFAYFHTSGGFDYCRWKGASDGAHRVILEILAEVCFKNGKLCSRVRSPVLGEKVLKTIVEGSFGTGVRVVQFSPRSWAAIYLF